MKTIWKSLGVAPSELRIDLTLNCGQSFRWKATGDLEWTSVLANRIISLKQTGLLTCAQFYSAYHSDSDVLYACHNQGAENVEPILHDYFQLKYSLPDLYNEWRKDKNFDLLSLQFQGVRMLRYVNPFPSKLLIL